MKLKYYLILLGLIIIIAGCDSNTTTTTEGYYKCFSGNTQMISAVFDSYSPISFENSPYVKNEEIPVEVVLTNNMPEEIEPGKVKVKLKGDAAISSIFEGAKIATNPKLYAIDSENCFTSDENVELGPIRYQSKITTKVSKEISGDYCYEKPVIVHGYLYYTNIIENIGVNLPSGANPPSGLQVISLTQEPVKVGGDGKTAELDIKITVGNVGTGTLVKGLDECFEFRSQNYREEFDIEVNGAYDIECDKTELRLNRETKQAIVNCKATGIDASNLASTASEIEITLKGFAYEDVITPVTVWLEP